MKYVVAVFCVMLGMGLVHRLVRTLADLLIVLIMAAAAVFVCRLVHQGAITSWGGGVILVSTLAGVGAGILCIPLFPYRAASGL